MKRYLIHLLTVFGLVGVAYGSAISGGGGVTTSTIFNNTTTNGTFIIFGNLLTTTGLGGNTQKIDVATQVFTNGGLLVNGLTVTNGTDIEGVLTNGFNGPITFLSTTNFGQFTGASNKWNNAQATRGGSLSWSSGGGTNGQSGATITMFGAGVSGGGSITIAAGAGTNTIGGGGATFTTTIGTVSGGFNITAPNSSVAGLSGGTGTLSSGSGPSGGLAAKVVFNGADGVGNGGFVNFTSGGTSNAPGGGFLLDDGDTSGNAGSATFTGINTFSVTFTQGTASVLGNFALAGVTAATINNQAIITNATLDSGTVTISGSTLQLHNPAASGSGTLSFSTAYQATSNQTASSSLTDVVGLSNAVTTTAGQGISAHLTATAQFSGSSSGDYLALVLDGTNIICQADYVGISGLNADLGVSISGGATNLSAGVHNVKVRFSSSSGGVTKLNSGNSSNTPSILVIEAH